MGLIVMADDLVDDLEIPDDPIVDLDRSPQALTLRTEKRRYGKRVVDIFGLETPEELVPLASGLTAALGTGGTVMDGYIEVHGDRAARVRDRLTDRGYQVSGDVGIGLTAAVGVPTANEARRPTYRWSVR